MKPSSYKRCRHICKSYLLFNATTATVQVQYLKFNYFNYQNVISLYSCYYSGTAGIQF